MMKRCEKISHKTMKNTKKITRVPIKYIMLMASVSSNKSDQPIFIGT